MAKKALLDVLEKTIGKYVCNLDTNSLNVAVWSGKIELHSLELDVAAVNAELDRQSALAPNLALPLRVVDGRFTSFEVDVPWAHLTSKPVIARAKGLQISVEPIDPSTFGRIDENSEATAEKQARDSREQSVSSANDYRVQTNVLTKLAENDLKGDKDKTDTGFVAKLVRRIIENLQFEISDVHVTLLGSEASAGVVLKSLRLMTTDESGKQTFVNRTTQGTNNTFLFKSLELRGLGAYLDEKGGGANKTPLEAINEESDVSDEVGTDHSYVLAPLSFQARLRQADGNVCIDYPKYLLESELSSLSILLSKAQLELARKIQLQIEPAVNAPRPLFPEYRPVGKLTRATAREWWRYAYRCVGRLNGRRSWVEFFRAFQMRNEYLELYKRHAHSGECPWMTVLSAPEKSRLVEIEEDWSISVEGLMTWRNIADARMTRELEKKEAQKPKASLFGSIFGKGESQKKSDDDPPINLSPEELKELETLTLRDVEATNGELSKDSKLCDLKFVLGSFTVNLLTHDMRSLSALQMGKVTTTWNANADGSFKYDLVLRSLSVEDRITPHTLFPTIMSNQKNDKAGALDDYAFNMRVEKTKAGDQKLIMKLMPFEMVASPVMVRELSNFAAVQNLPGPPQTVNDNNPMLRQSMTGSVDLFYDATDGVDFSVPKDRPIPSGRADTTNNDFSSTLFDAWKEKTESKTLWILDLDLAAPIIVIPENCTKPQANILVLNLGHLTLRYGDIDASDRVHDWFSRNPLPVNTVEPQYDYGTIQVTSLTFVIGRAENWKQVVRYGKRGANDVSADAVLAPITASLDIGLESQSAQPRVAVFLVLPVIAGALSPSRVSSILSVTGAWQKLFADVSPKTNGDHIEDDGLSVATAGSSTSQIRAAAQRATELLRSTGGPEQERFPSIHFDLRLQRVSAHLFVEEGSGVEAHLVSVSSSATTYSDGSAAVRLSMGWFWVLDRLQNDFARVQRLVAHSSLPMPVDSFTEDSKYDILGELERRGVFQESFEGSSDLADIMVRHSSKKRFGSSDPFRARFLQGDDYHVDTIVDAKFTSLHVNWNPYAVKKVVSSLDSFTKLLLFETANEKGSAVILDAAPARKRKSSINSRSRVGGIEDGTEEQASCIIIRVELDGVELALRSALDDLPLFTLSMSQTTAGLSMATGKDGGMKIDLSVGNLQAFSTDLGRTCDSYRTIVGISPGKSDSLLTFSYSDGPRAMKLLENMEGIESFGVVQLSPMRMVYIQSQILALVDYTTEGILGAITLQAASTAAAAAANLAVTGSRKKCFKVVATGFEVLVPRAAYEESYLAVRTGALAVEYNILPHPGGGEANISLAGMMLVDSRQQSLLSEPAELEIIVVLPEEGVGTEDDQAMRIRVQMSGASFTITKAQYDDVLILLDRNIGEPDLHLRDSPTAEGQSVNSDFSPGMTHAGEAVVDKPRRIYVSVDFACLSLALFFSDLDDPLIRLTTEETKINASLFPNGERTAFRVSMNNLECFDERVKSLGRQHRSLVYQSETTKSFTAANNLFSLQFETGIDRKTDMKLSIGTPTLVFIPDAVSDALRYFAPSENSIPEKSNIIANSRATVSRQVVEIDDSAADQGVEATYTQQLTVDDGSSHYSVSIVTSDFFFVFVDLGSTSIIDSVKLRSSMARSAAETFVLKGAIDCRLDCRVSGSNILSAADLEVHGDGFEAYTAYGGRHDALQMLEPARLSVYANVKTEDDNAQVVDLRIASVTPIEMCVSMKNIALVNAILSGITDCFDSTEDILRGDLLDHKISQKEAEHIEKLALALESVDDSDSSSTGSVALSRRSSTLSSSTHQESSAKYTLSTKLTLPGARMTVVNDLQGLDDALFRVSLQNLVASAFVQNGVVDHRMKDPFVAFETNLNCSIASDYFDESSRLWKQLLLKPWEITLRTQRGMNSRLSAKVPSTTCDIESFACQMAFTEQFLMSLAAAKHMWATYETATSSALESGAGDVQSARLRRTIAASAARTLVTVRPYVIENHSGKDLEFAVDDGHGKRRSCLNGTMEYFRFPQPQGEGFGGRRLYGQDRTTQNSLTIFAGESSITIPDVDSEVSGVRHLHVLRNFEVLFSHVAKEGKTMVIHVTSSVDFRNECLMPFDVFIEKSKSLSRSDPKREFVGTCHGKAGHSDANLRSPTVSSSGRMTKDSSKFGLPVTKLEGFQSEWSSFNKATLSLSIAPKLHGIADADSHVGGIEISLEKSMFQKENSRIASSFDVSCRCAGADSLVVQVRIIATLLDGSPFVEVTLAPRALLHNRIPLSMSIRTPMPHTFSQDHAVSVGPSESYQVHHLAPNDSVQVFTPGPSIAISLRCTDNPVAGNPTDWMEGGWVDLPLISEFRLPEPFFVYLPFPMSHTSHASSRRGGTEIVIADKLSTHWDLPAASDGSQDAIEVSAVTEKDDWRTYFIGISNYAVDHTGEILFEDGEDDFSNRASLRRSFAGSAIDRAPQRSLSPLGAYRSERHHGRITLLPLGKKRVKLLHLTMEGEAGYQESAPFFVEDIAICEGGAEATSIPWETGDTSGFFAYRRLMDSYQSEIHVIPEYVVYNGSTTHTIRVKQPGRGEVTVKPGKIAPLRSDPRVRLAISVEYADFGGRTAPMNVDTAALRFAVIRAPDGHPMGSVALQTVVGTQDSRWVVKLSELKAGASQLFKPKKHSILENDILRFRVQWSELRITLNETPQFDETEQAIIASTLNPIQIARPRASMKASSVLERPEMTTWVGAQGNLGIGRLSSREEQQSPVCTLLFHRFTVDWQRVFKDEPSGQIQSHPKFSSERSQLSVIIHNVQLRDETKGSKYPIVFDSTTDASFFDLCIRCRGPLSAELINVNLVDLNLSFREGRARPVVIKLTEEFIWKLLDVGNRIIEAASEFSGYHINLQYDEEHEGYVVTMSDHKASFIEDESKYTPPDSSTLYDIEKVQVSPVTIVASFDRAPQKSRYEKRKKVRGGALVNYFTRQLKFKIDQAELCFGSFHAKNIKGGLDRLIELLSTAYSSRMKFKVLSILSAASFQDWKNIASRQGGDDEYLEGDIMRVTGNLAGRSAGFILKQAGMGLGDGIRKATSKVGDGIETVAGSMGVRSLGTGANHVVSGVGQGFGETLTGFGTGAGKVFAGAGQGVGQVFGGLTGGVMNIGKGIGKGFQGDGKGMVEGLGQGVTSVGKGVGDGVGSAVGGAADGVATLGKGLFSGAKSIGKGFGSAVRGKPKKRDNQS